MHRQVASRIRIARVAALFHLAAATAELPPDYEPLQRTCTFEGVERTFFVVLPDAFDVDTTCWALCVVHGGGGNARTNAKAIALHRMAGEMDLPAILVLPEFITSDRQVSRFPVLGEDRFLKAVLECVHAEFNVHEKILLTGYSMGGQFSHRFALANPGLVKACAAFAAGTWTTPDGRLLIEEYGEVEHPESFLLSRENAGKVPERLHDLFDARTAGVAGLLPAKDAREVPFLIMCGVLDTRFSIAKAFAESLRESGFTVETVWPKTPHSSGLAEYATEFEKYPKHAVAFFKKHTDDEPQRNEVQP